MAISRLLRKKDDESLSKALGEFKEVYSRETHTQTGLNGLINFLNEAKGKSTSNLLARSVVGSSLLNLAGFGLSPEAILARGAGV